MERPCEPRLWVGTSESQLVEGTPDMILRCGHWNTRLNPGPVSPAGAETEATAGRPGWALCGTPDPQEGTCPATATPVPPVADGCEPLGGQSHAAPHTPETGLAHPRCGPAGEDP